MVDDTSSSSPIAQPNDEKVDRDAGKMLAEALASLQLPQMPDDDDDDKDGLCDRALPSVTILVCADIDLASTSALAEYLLMDQPHINVDLIIAAGPCTRDEDLLTYCQGTAQRSKYKRRRQLQQFPAATFSHPAAATTAQNSSFYSAENSHSGVWTELTPFYRSCEESAAMEGLLTSALSQLESIVCRVLYCPGFSDPFSVILNADSKRLTPNSRILHRQWLPLVPGLGCAGVFYLDGTERVANTVASSYHADDSDASDDEENEINSAMLLTEQLKKMQQSTSGYIPTLSQLLQLAPEADKNNLLHAGKSQSILVTHYVDGATLVPHDDEGDSISRTEESDQGELDDLFHPAHCRGRGIGNAAGPGKADIETECRGCSTMPWPIDHKEFLMNDSTSRHLCFEIASGSAVSHPAAWMNKNKETVRNVRNRPTAGARSCCCLQGPVLLPGSLRERGEFSIVKVALVEQSTKMEQHRFAWEVQNVEFYNLGSYE